MTTPKFNKNQNTWEIDVPEDNSCLFWSVALAYLIPVKDNDHRFRERFKKLFGKKSLDKLGHVKNWIKAYNPFLAEATTTYQDKTLNELIKKKFCRQVFDYIKDHESEFKDQVEGNFEEYLCSIQNSNSREGEPEIRAISDLLDCRIQVITTQGVRTSYGEEETLIQLFHVGALANSQEANHYRFRIEKSLGDDNQSAIKSVLIPEHKAATTSVKRLGTEKEPPHKEARYDQEENRVVVQEPERQLKQLDTKEEPPHKRELFDKEAVEQQLKQLITEKDILYRLFPTNINVTGFSGAGHKAQGSEITAVGLQQNIQLHEEQQDPHTSYFSEVEIYGIDFKKDVIELRQFLEGKSKVLHLSFTGKNTLLGYITTGILFKKIKEEINNKARKTEVEQHLDNYTKGKGLRVANLDCLLQQDEVLNDFKKSERNNLLVIECTSDPDQHKVKEKFRKLSDVLKQIPTKKVIFISIDDKKQESISDSIRTFFEKKLGEHYKEKAGDEIKFSDLTDGSEYNVLEKKVLFQGQPMCLSRLMGIEDPDNLSQKELDKLNKVLDAAALLELIETGKEIRIETGGAPPDWDDLDTFRKTYIPRSFNRRIAYEDKALTKNVGDLFSVGDIAETDFKKLIPEKETIQLFNSHNSIIDPHKRFILLDSRTQNDKDQEEVFNKLCSSLQEHHKDKVIHWLKKEKEELVWQRTWSQSQTYVYGTGASKEANNNLEPIETTQVPDKIVVVIDEPGMGKSTTLTHVSEQARKDNKWVIRINLKDHQETIEKQLVQDDQSLLDLLTAIDTQGLKATLARRILDYRLRQQEEIVLLLDGFDEISSSCQDKVLQLLQFLKDKQRAEKVWITARLHTKAKLEDALSVFSYRFQPFDTTDQQRFLNRFWTNRLIGGQSAGREAHEDCLTFYAGELINKFSSPKSTSLKTKTLGDVIGIPLITSMLAEIFFNDLKSFYDHNKGKTEFALGSDSKLHILNIVELYEEFIKAKYEIYLKEKISIEAKINPGTKQILIDGYTKVHQCLAFGTLFPEQIKSFSGARMDQFSNDEQAAIGIIKDFKSNAPHFIHPTFAEYFVADLIYMRLSNDKPNPTSYATVKKFLQEHLFEAKNDMIRLFLDYKLARGLPVHVAVLNSEKKELRALVKKDAASSRQADILGRKPLHLAAAYGYKTIIDQLINQEGSINTADELGEYPLSYAILSRDEEFFRLILSKGRFPSSQTDASKKILLATIQMVVQRWETGMLKLLLSVAYVHRSQITVILSANNYATFRQAVHRGGYEGRNMMEYIWSEASIEQRQSMWASIDAVKAFQKAMQKCGYGGREIADSLWKKASAEQQKEMWTSIDAVGTFQQAVQNGGYEGRKIADSLWKKASAEQQKEMWTSIDAVGTFQQAVQNGGYEGRKIADSLWKKASAEQQKEMWNSIDAVGAFQLAVQKGDYYGSKMVESLWKKASAEQQKEMLAANNYVSFALAVQNGGYYGNEMVESLWKKASAEQQKEMRTSIDAVGAFQLAVQKGNYYGSKMVESLWKIASAEQQKEMLAANNYVSFALAVQKGDYYGSEMMESLWEKASAEQQKEMWTSIDAVGVFQLAVQKGDYYGTNMVESLWKKASAEQQKEMLAANDYAAFQLAVQKGGYEGRELMENLWKKASAEQQKEMWTSIDAVGAFQLAVQKGGYEGRKIMESLWKKASVEQQKEMLAANNYAAFQLAVQKGGHERGEIVESFWKIASVEEQKEMWTSIDAVEAFQQAIKSCDYRMVESLWEKASAEQQKEMWTSIDSAGAFQLAVQKGGYYGSKIMEGLWKKASAEQ